MTYYDILSISGPQMNRSKRFHQAWCAGRYFTSLSSGFDRAFFFPSSGSLGFTKSELLSRAARWMHAWMLSWTKTPSQDDFSWVLEVSSGTAERNALLVSEGNANDFWEKSQPFQASGAIWSHDCWIHNLVGGDWNMTFIFPYIENNHPN